MCRIIRAAGPFILGGAEQSTPLYEAIKFFLKERAGRALSEMRLRHKTIQGHVAVTIRTRQVYKSSQAFRCITSFACEVAPISSCINT